jgi:hypothetical protein
MANKRKTVDISFLKNSANRALTDMADFQDKSLGESAKPFRQGIAMVLETALHESGNYNGFRYTDFNRGLTDPTRRYYY